MIRSSLFAVCCTPDPLFYLWDTLNSWYIDGMAGVMDLDTVKSDDPKWQHIYMRKMGVIIFGWINVDSVNDD